jgi:hypothetical protein
MAALPWPDEVTDSQKPQPMPGLAAGVTKSGIWRGFSQLTTSQSEELNSFR